MKEKKERSNEINLLKFVALILVILIHDRLPGTIGTVMRGIAAMAVPVFFMISGYFSYGETVKTIQKRTLRIVSLVVLANGIYFAWDIIVELLSGYSPVVWLKENCSVKRILVFLLTNESSFRGHLWFLGALLYAYLFLLCVMWCMDRRHFSGFFEKNQHKCLFILSALLLFVNIAGGELLTQYGRNIQIPYIRNWLFCGIPFFCIGYSIHGKEEQIRQLMNGKKLGKLFLLSFVLNVVEVFFMQQSELYFMTIFLSITMFLLALYYQGGIRSRLLILAGKTADRYGFWIYILQIIVIKNIAWFQSAYGMESDVVMQWGRPVVSFFITLLFAVIVVQIQVAGKSVRRSSNPAKNAG